MKFILQGAMLKNASTTLVFYFDKGILTLESTYFESDLPKCRLTTKLKQDSILQLYAGLDAVLTGNSKAHLFSIRNPDRSLVFKLASTQPSTESKNFDFRVENTGQLVFVQLTHEASAFHALRLFLQCVMMRIF
jgi:hypothetical protein